MRKWICCLLLGLASLAALAADAPPAAEDPVLEKKMLRITEELRCLVCQNQNIADSHADLAVDLKNQVREMLKKGMSEEAIKDYMVQRYGDFVLYRPPVKSATWLLWFGPFVLLLGGLLVLVLKLRRRATLTRDADQLSEDEHRQALALLQGQSGEPKGQGKS